METVEVHCDTLTIGGFGAAAVGVASAVASGRDVGHGAFASGWWVMAMSVRRRRDGVGMLIQGYEHGTRSSSAAVSLTEARATLRNRRCRGRRVDDCRFRRVAPTGGMCSREMRHGRESAKYDGAAGLDRYCCGAVQGQTGKTLGTVALPAVEDLALPGDGVADFG
jgi:hypothetical protein